MVHVGDEADILVYIFRGPGGRSCEYPLSVLLDIEVEAVSCYSVGVLGILDLAEFRPDGDDAGIGLEGYRHAGSHPDLGVLPLSEPLEYHGVNPVVRVRRVGHQVPYEREVGSFDETEFDTLWSLCHQGQGTKRGC